MQLITRRINTKDYFNVVNVLALTALTAVLYRFNQGITNYLSESTSIEGISAIAYVMVFIVGSGALVLVYYSIRIKDDHPMIWAAIVFSLVGILSTSLSGLYPTSRLPFRYVDISYWAFVMLLMYYAVRKCKKLTLYLFIVAIAFPFLLYSYFGMKSIESPKTLLLNPVYYIMFLLPVMLLLKSNVFKLIAVVAVFAALVMSYKRGGFIAFLLGMVVYAYYQIQINETAKAKKGKFLIAVIFVIVIGFYVYQDLSSTYGMDWISRFESLMTDGGSNRTLIWSRIINSLRNQEGQRWMLGNGYRATSVFGGAHNDLLEIIYDYGIIGTVSYSFFIATLMKTFFLMKKRKYLHYPVFASSIVMFLVYSMVGQMIILPYWILGLSVFWGISIADFRNREEIKLEDIVGM